ncbi:MAG TPA: alkaline phosphatase family protein [Anaerolineales bacterium]|nr:alkaline phosphatase family protein [Anaerolineales bacterium]
MAGAKRVLIIGIDGATFDLVKPWLEAGSLPNLQKIYEGGASCVLLSTLPSNSPPAWTSFMTGMNPGKHGLYGFTRVVPEQGYSRKINSGAVRKVPSVFQYLTTLGYRSAAINMPMLYPPDPINGVIVTGIDTPGTDSEFTYPHELRHKIFELIPNYILDVRSWGAFLTTEKRAHLFEDIINMIDHRKKLTLQLLSEETWDLFSVVFTATDRAQHFFWRYLDKNHPLYDPDEAAKYKDAIWLVHKKIDDAIGELLAYCDEDTTVAVMSDHGFGPQLRLFRLNQWMLENGFLSLANSNSN